MKFSKLAQASVVMFVVVMVSGQSAFSKDICSDAYMSQKIQPFANRAQNATGICATAKAGITLYTESIKLVNPCLGDPGLSAYKQELEKLLRDAKNQAAASCG
ncbi:hypothetical protein [Agrobacterium tumefaciens]|uniref:hypothetical protein n=1 Tax=Agrobacterium tumefaciens TaxID=358 RepID=UPI00287CB96E|nr:hypothetical protein [Agrobacterium tumefaciens]MDS7594870.1 hypothetical protein [Agrobacterium tumefaciens]